MAVGDVLIFKRTVIVPKKEDLAEVTITNATPISNISANLILRNASNGFYAYDVIIKARQIAAAGLTNFKFIITNLQNDQADVNGVEIATVTAADTLFATDTVRLDTTNNVLSTHTLLVYGDPTP